MPYPAPKLSFAETKLFFNGLWAPRPTYTEKDYPSFDGKVVLITGGNTGVGYETAKSLAGSTNAKVYIFSRSEEKTLAAIAKLKVEVAKDYGKQNADVHFIQANLADLSTIKPAVNKFLSRENRLDLIIHNAGVYSSSKNLTAQGHEINLGTNVIGPHLLQKLLDPIFIKTSESNRPGESRIVWVASSSQLASPVGGVNWDDVNNNDCDNINYVYGQSKAMNIIQAIEWPKRHPEANRTLSSSICPGALRSELARDSPLVFRLFARFFDHQRFGAYTELYAAFSPDIKNGAHTIAYGNPGTIRKDIESDLANHKKVWNFLEEQVKDYC